MYVNVYGPTEDTIFCSTYRFKRNSDNKSHNGVLSIGKPMKKKIVKLVNIKEMYVMAKILVYN